MIFKLAFVWLLKFWGWIVRAVTKIQSILKPEVIYSFWMKNTLLIVIGFIAVMILTPGKPEWSLINKITLLEIQTLLLCQLAVYVHHYSPVTFKINTGKDGVLNSTEQHALIQSNSRIYQSVHIFVGLVVLAVYFLEKGGI